METLLCFVERFEPNASRKASVYPVYPGVGLVRVLCVALYVPNITYCWQISHRQVHTC